MDRDSWHSHNNISMGPSRGGAGLTVDVHALCYLPEEALRADSGDLVDVHLGLQEVHKALQEGHKVLSTPNVAGHLWQQRYLRPSQRQGQRLDGPEGQIQELQIF